MLKKVTNEYIQGSQSYLLFDDQAHDDFQKIEESHRGVGKSKFLCRLMMYYVSEIWTSVVMSFKTSKDIEYFLSHHLIPALRAHPNLRYRRKSNTEIIVGESYNIDVSIRKPDISICMDISKVETQEQVTTRLQNYSMNGYQMMQHDSVLVDMRMVKDLKILKEPDEKLPLYIGHKWNYKLLHQDYLERLKNIRSFAAAV